jgi:drug/metabolite transporter (DMT)-like permease
MTSGTAAAGFGLASATAWGGSDFAGGLGARRAPALLVVAPGHILTLLILLALCLGMRIAAPGPAYLFYAAVGGFEGALALAIFYRALAMGAMGLTAALTGLLTALVPVIFGILKEGPPTMLAGAGLLLGCAAIWLITHAPGKRGEATPGAALLMGAFAGLGFGAQMILFKMASAGGLLWAMTSARAAGVAALVLFLLVMPPKGPRRGFWLASIVAGVFDTAGNGLYIAATQLGRLDAAALICSLYPGVTILLAALVLREWPTRRQAAGMVLALAAVALLSR